MVVVVVVEYAARHQNTAPAHRDHFTQLNFLMPFADDRLHLRELPQFVRFLIGALVIEVFTEPS